MEQSHASLKEDNASRQFCIFLRAKNLSEFLKVKSGYSMLFWQGQRKADWHSKKILSNVEVVNIKYPKKVCTIFFILQYFAFLNVCSLAFPQALQEDILVMY